MATPDHAQWVQRGRTRLTEGRAVDAIRCFRQAARLAPDVPAAHLGLGEAFWQLGRPGDAIGAWREAVRCETESAAAREALAEALLATGGAAEARDVAASARAIAPDGARATVLHAIARLSLGESVEGAAADVAAALDRQPTLVARPLLMGPLALALDGPVSGSASADALLARIGAIPGAFVAAPPLLLALALERMVGDPRLAAADLIAAARGLDYRAADHEALRRIARATARLDADAGRELASRYATLCVAAFAPPVPLTWPRRSAGARLRVAALVGGNTDAVARAAVRELPHDRFALSIVLLDGAEPLAGFVNLAVPDATDPAGARSVAAIDADIVIDLAGLDSSTGPLLAQRPGRANWSLRELPAANVAPLVERTIPVAALAAALTEAAETLLEQQGCALDAGALARLWDGAVGAQRKGDRAAALAGCERLLAVQPEFAPALVALGMARREAGDLDAARRLFDRAVAAAPGNVDARLAAAALAESTGDPARAVALCDEGTARAPQDARLWRALGHAQLARRDGAAAAAAFRRALALDPADGETHYNRGVALQMQGDYVKATNAYQRALVLAPRLVAADFNLGVIFQEQGATAAAIAAYETVLTADPVNVAAYKNLGEVLLASGRDEEFVAHFRRFEQHCPDALALVVQALEAYQILGDFAQLDRYLDGLARGRFTAADDAERVDAFEELLFQLLYFDVAPEMLHDLARTYDTAARRVYGAPLPPSPGRRPGRLRLGYLSGDLRSHVMGKMMWAAIRHHDRDRFELSFFSTSTANDEWTERFRGIADRFEIVAGLSERAAAERIATADIDLLVDLSTNTRGAKPGILALKPARVQITHIASAGTVGLSTIDFKLTDHFCEAAGNQRYQIEALLPMDGCVYPWQHVAAAAVHPFQRAALGIAADTLVIGAFVTAWKLSRRCLALWREILDRLPRARLAFSPPPAQRARYVRLAAAAGIAPDRLVFVPLGRDDAENRARYTLVDFALDPMPYGGVNGTLEALDMGVPVVTLVGRRHGERQTYSMLANLGVLQTVAAAPSAYVEIAVRLATDARFAAEVRDAIAAGLRQSPLTDMPAHTRALERAYLDALAARAPEAIAGAGLAGGNGRG